MKIKSLQISNILSFKYHDDISNAEKIIFEDGLNIIIGENGSGKSTALEVINFIFKRVLYKQYNVNQELYSRKSLLNVDERKQILAPANNNVYNGFRLEPNWDSEGEPQTIRLEIKLDDIDAKNIKTLQENIKRLNSFINPYTGRSATTLNATLESYTLDIALNSSNKTFSVTFKQGQHDFGYEYLVDYNFYKESISLYNLEHPKEPLDSLYESFTLISSYRNYHAFERSISLRDQHPSQQMQQIRNLDYAKSLNTSDKSEPTIFGLVRLRIAEKHFNLISQKLDESECEAEANKLSFIVKINDKLRVVNLECKIKLIDLRTWQYSFEFYDLKRGKIITDINSLSAGQKAIVHLVFEAYGRGDVKGGLVIIDEPEIHLHYQFQNEYLQVIRDLNSEQSCQYILVTHSEALINSSTINHVKRFFLNADGNTEIKAPTLTTDEKVLIRILDNTRSTHAFFAKKVLLVEGDTDRYFYRSIVQDNFPGLDQEIAILHISGKGNHEEWRKLFESFGLVVYFIADFDCIVERFYPQEKGVALKTQTDIAAFKARHQDWEQKIEGDYANRIYILKEGDLEHYLGISKGLDVTINFCNKDLATLWKSTTSPKVGELKSILAQVTA